MTKVLLITADEAEDIEVLYPYYRLKEENFVVDVASIKRGPITFKHGYSIEAQLSFDEVLSNAYDILVIPGGKGPEKVRLNEAAVRIVRDFMSTGKPVAAICHGPQVLVSAGAVKGRTMTSWKGIKDDLISAGARYEDKEVVVDGKLITSRMPSDLPAFTKTIISMLNKGESRSTIGEIGQHVA